MKNILMKVKLSTYEHWIVLTYVFIFQFFTATIARSVAPMATVIAKDMQLTSVEIGYFPAALFLGQAIISIPSGYLTDKIGTRKMFLIITILLCFSFYLLTFSSTLTFILICIVFAGFSYGASHPATNRAIIDWFPITQRGTAMGIKQTSVTIGSAFAAICLLPIANGLSWKWAYIIVTTTFIIVGIYVTYRYKEKGESRNNTIGTTNLSNGKFKALWKNNKLILITLTAFILSGVQMILNTFIVFYSLEYIQLSLFISGFLLVIAEVGGSVGRVLWGIVSDTIFRGNRIIVILIICILVSVMAFIVAFLPPNTPFLLFVLTVFFFGIGSNGFNGIWMNAASEVTTKMYAGMATGISITFGSLGAVCLPPVFGYILDKTNIFTYGWLSVSLFMLIPIALIFFHLIFRKKGRI